MCVFMQENSKIKLVQIYFKLLNRNFVPSCRRFREEGLPDKTIEINLVGSGGQSFCAFLAKGVHVTLEGDANDYVGKVSKSIKLYLFSNGGLLAKCSPQTVISIWPSKCFQMHRQYGQVLPESKTN